MVSCLLLASAPAAISAAEVVVAIRDAGRPSAAAVRFFDFAGKLIVPESALNLAAMGYLYAAGNLIHYADWTATQVRSQDPFFGSSYFRASHPPGTACFFVDGGFRVTVPPGRYTLTVNKGLEYEPVTRVVDVSGARSEIIDLVRWVNMAQAGWYSGDGHVHIERASPAADRAVMQWAAAEDVHAVNVLLMGDARQTYYPQYGFGSMGTVAADGRAIIPGQEDPRTKDLGHTLHLGIAAPVRDAEKYYAYAPVLEQVHRGGGLSGLAHVGRRRWFFEADRALSLAAPRGLVDFVEIAEMGYIGVNTWYEFLNLGFRLTAMGGSDVPWGGTIGGTRVYAHLAGPFDSGRWLEAVRLGHTFVTTGPMLEFTVNDRLPGSVLSLKRGDPIRVKARVRSNPGTTRPARLKIVSFGKTLAETKESKVELELMPQRSLWITVQVETNEHPLMDLPGFFSGAVATPVYVEVDGAPSRDEDRLGEWVAARLKSLDAIETWLKAPAGSDGNRGGWESSAARSASAAAIRSEVKWARAWYLDLEKAAREKSARIR